MLISSVRAAKVESLNALLMVASAGTGSVCRRRGVDKCGKSHGSEAAREADPPGQLGGFYYFI